MYVFVSSAAQMLMTTPTIILQGLVHPDLSQYQTPFRSIVTKEMRKEYEDLGAVCVVHKYLASSDLRTFKSFLGFVESISHPEV